MLNQKIKSAGSFFDFNIIFSLFSISVISNFTKMKSHNKTKAIEENHSSVILFKKSATALAMPTNKTPPTPIKSDFKTFTFDSPFFFQDFKVI